MVTGKNIISIGILSFLLLFPLQDQASGEQFLNNPQYIAGRGYGQNQKAAQQAALGEIAAYFTAEISASTQEKTG